MTLRSVNTRDVDLAPVIAVLQDAWPRLPWDQPRFGHGAFHGVIFMDDTVVRVACGADHRQRAEAEAANARAFGRLASQVSVPTLVHEPVSTEDWTASAHSRIPGQPMRTSEWAEARRVYLPLLDQLRALSVHQAAVQALRPLREWCGGDEWPLVADEVAQRLHVPALRRRAHDTVARVLDAEANVSLGVVHGDLNPYNVLVGAGTVGLIDVDHAAIADPAIDLSWLLRAFPLSDLRRDLSVDELDRASIHRSAGPLQVAAAAQLIGDTSLRDHALQNFEMRAIAEPPP